MKQIKKEKVFTNAYIGPWSPMMSEIHQASIGVKDSLVTNIAIIKDYVKSHKPQFRNSILDEFK